MIEIMSEIELLSLESQKSQSSGEKRSPAISPWDDSILPDRAEVPLPLNSGSCENVSPQSLNSYFIRSDRKNEETQETNFSISTKEAKGATENVLPLPGDSEEFSSSDSECLSAGHKKLKKFLRTNKVNDIKTPHEENKKDSSYNFKVKKNLNSTSDLSYRERIRDRFHIMKEKAVESLSRPQSQLQFRMKFLEMRQGSRMDELLRQEEDQVSAAMVRHEKIKLRWQHILKSSIEKKTKTQDEDDNFFIEIQKQSSPGGSKSAEESENVSEKEAKEDSKVLASEFLSIKEEWELVDYISAQKINTKKDESWEKYLFYPSTKTVSLEEKLEPGLIPRFKEEEGFYVGKKITIPPKIKNKMECRILKTADSRKWFGSNGSLVLPTCPLKPFSIRPISDDKDHFTLTQVVYKPATSRDMDHQYMDLSGNLNFVFDIDLNSIEFSHHSLFSREHVVAQRLKDLYIKYKKKKEADHLNRLNERLNALRKTRDNLKVMTNQSGDNKHFVKELQKCEQDIKEVKQLRYLEGQIDKKLTNNIVMTWKDLLKLREEQGYQNTLLNLSIKKKFSDNLEQEKIKWDAEIKLETQETVEDLSKSYEKALEVYNEKFEIWSQNIKKMTKEEKRADYEGFSEGFSDIESPNESVSDKDEPPEEPIPPQPVEISDIRSQVTKNFKKSFRQPGEPEIECTLTQAVNSDKPVYDNKCAYGTIFTLSRFATKKKA